MQPNGKWLVHDDDRAAAGRRQAGPVRRLPAPADAIVLLGAGNGSEQVADDAGRRRGHAGRLPTACCRAARGMIRTKRDDFTDYQLHVEFATPSEVKGNSQGRGNSGVFLNGVFEIQVLDSYDNKTYRDGQASAMYGQFPPMVNASRRPGEWQSYDIIFTRAALQRRRRSRSRRSSPCCTTASSSTISAGFWGPTAHKADPALRAVERQGLHRPAGPRQSRALPQHLGPRAESRRIGRPSTSFDL